MSPAAAFSFDEPSAQRLRRKSFAWAALFCLLWGVIETLGAYSRLPAVEVVWMRYGVHLLAMLLLSTGQLRSLVRTRTPILQIGCSLMMLSMPLMFLAGAHTAGVRDTETVFWMAPLLAVLIAQVRGERIHEFTWVSVLFGWFGAALILRPTINHLLPAIPGGVGMSLSFALYLVGARRMAHESTRSKLFYTALFVFIPLTLLMPRFYRPPNLTSLAIVSVVGLLGLLGLFALDRSLELASESWVGPVMFLQPLLSAVIGLAFVSHAVGRLAAIGVVLIVAAVGIHVAAAGHRPNI